MRCEQRDRVNGHANGQQKITDNPHFLNMKPQTPKNRISKTIGTWNEQLAFHAHFRTKQSI